MPNPRYQPTALGADMWGQEARADPFLVSETYQSLAPAEAERRQALISQGNPYAAWE